MHVFGLLGVVLPASDPDAARQWYVDTLGLTEHEDEPEALGLGDVAVTFGPALALRVVAGDLPDGSADRTDPSGTVVHLQPPDVSRAEAAEQHIRDFVTGADELSGPPVADLVADVARRAQRLEAELTELFAGVPHNKVLATQLALSQQSREGGATAMPRWAMQAASTLLSGLVVAGAQRGDQQ